MNGLKLLSSFVNGFGKADLSVIINAAYVAMDMFSVDFPFDFKSRGNRGVDSLEIRKILFFSEHKIRKNHEGAYRAAKQLSKVDSTHLGWLAQYIMNGETHLYSEETKEALKLKANLSKTTTK